MSRFLSPTTGRREATCDRKNCYNLVSTLGASTAPQLTAALIERGWTVKPDRDICPRHLTKKG